MPCFHWEAFRMLWEDLSKWCIHGKEDVRRTVEEIELSLWGIQTKGTEENIGRHPARTQSLVLHLSICPRQRYHVRKAAQAVRKMWDMWCCSKLCSNGGTSQNLFLQCHRRSPTSQSMKHQILNSTLYSPFNLPIPMATFTRGWSMRSLLPR
ncbi:hypothetical protein OE88DRAFT_915895 [Heliocybe sulcata]|uniref:Uncharacterized protein n=1 Tax=Heliocybe sulcata TaxID=5364 RepID=A0A5C3MNB5_9AGAM|nr:hypothetical protein OE88DRAFT_915895 [Heliocybe sulcata]